MRIYIALQDRLSFCLQYSETIFLASDHLVIILCIRSDLYVTDIQRAYVGASFFANSNVVFSVLHQLAVYSIPDPAKAEIAEP